MAVQVKKTFWERQLPRELAVAFWFFALAPLFLVPFWPRSFDLGNYVEALTEGFGFASYLTRGATAVAFILTGFLLLKVLLFGRWRVNFLLPVLFLYAGALASMAFSMEPRVSVGHLAYINMLALVALLASGKHLHELVLLFKKIALIYIWGSLLASLVAPGWALEIGYSQTYIPGFNLRLHGVTVHANHTALFPWIYILLEAAFPSKSRVARTLHVAVALLVLVLTQSKTVWALLLWGGFWILALRAFSASSLGKWVVVMVPLALGGGVFAVVQSWSANPDLVERVPSLLPEEAFTLTGRVFIWAVVMEILRENPWFGYGPDLWSPEMTLLYSSWTGWVPAQSHNQYLQSLGEGGWLGLAFFLAYSLWILVLAVRSLRVSSGIAFILFSGWLIRGFTEAWFRKATMDGNLLVHAMILALVVALYEQARKGAGARGGREVT